MQYRRLNAREWMLPLIILAFVGLSVTFLAPVFNTTTRWLVLVVAAAYLLLKGQLFTPLRHWFGIIALTHALWALLTFTWSEVPELSLMKSIALLLISLTGMAAGLLWVRQHELRNALAYLFPLTIIALAAGMLGRFTSTAEVAMNDGGAMLYQGAVAGSNMFGSMLAMCSPFVLWQLYSSWEHRRKRVLWLALLSAVAFYLVATQSRAAMLAFMCACGALFFASDARHKVLVGLAALTAAVSLWVLAPALVDQLGRDYVYKHNEDEGIFFSRLDPWAESYEQAVKGGIIGGGYGVSIGDDTFEAGLTTFGYGREKGNTQLAIMEETGVLGLGVYTLVIASLAGTVLMGMRRQRRNEARVQLYLVGGMLLGMTVQSVFEAWWVAPASPESVYFWALAGVALGLATDRRTEKSPSRVAQMRRPLQAGPARTFP